MEGIHNALHDYLVDHCDGDLMFSSFFSLFQIY